MSESVAIQNLPNAHDAEPAAVTTLRLGIANAGEMKAQTLAIARGKFKPGPDEPEVWFTSTESFARTLSDKNRRLLSFIAEHHPDSLHVVAEKTRRKSSNLSRTLRTMERYGFVNLHRGVCGKISPEVVYLPISLTLPYASPTPVS